MPSPHADFHPRPSRSPRSGQRRPILLALATGLALLAAGSALSRADIYVPPSARAAEANAEVVRDFYGAVNDAIRTGDADALDTIVTPEFSWCQPCSGHSPTRDGLKDYLVGLHRTAPEAQLSVEAVVSGFEDMVTAQIHAFGYPAIDELTSWGPVDVLRLTRGLITERRSGPEGIALVEPLFRARLDSLPPAVTGLTMARLTFPAGSSVSGLLSAGPTLVVVESGSIAISTAGGGRIVRAGGEEQVMETSRKLSGVLHQGDAAIVPLGVRHGLRQQGTEPAVALGATLFYDRDDLDHPTAPGPDIAPFFPPGWFVGDEAQLFPTVHPLAGGSVDTWPSGPVEIAIGRAMLGPDTRVLSSPAESLLLAVETGSLDLSSGELPPIAPGAGAVQPAGSPHEFHNAGSGVLILLVLTIAPIAEDASEL